MGISSEYQLDNPCTYLSTISNKMTSIRAALEMPGPISRGGGEGSVASHDVLNVGESNVTATCSNSRRDSKAHCSGYTRLSSCLQVCLQTLV